MTLRDDVRYEAATTTLTAVVALLEDVGASPELVDQVWRLKMEIRRERMARTIDGEPSGVNG